MRYNQNMIDVGSHPIWKNVNPIKKQGHLARLFMAKQYAKLIPQQKIIAVVGAVGKTTTAVAAREVLAQKFLTISSTETNKQATNLDPIFNLPMTLLRVRPNIKKVILELGIELPGEMEFYLNIVKPYKVIVTKLSYEHNEFLGSLEQVLEEEGKVVNYLPKSGALILNWDDPFSRKLADKTEAEVIYYGIDPKHCHVYAGNIKIQNLKTIFELNYGVERVLIESDLLGKHQVYPLLAAAALGISEGLTLTTIKKGLEKVKPIEHRMEALPGYNGSVIIDDTYNAQPVAVEEALEVLNHIPARRRIVVLGEMKELGSYTEKMHREIARKIYNDKVDLVFLGPGDTKYLVDELNKLGFIEERLLTNQQNPQLVSQLIKILAKGDVVLVKGARSNRLDEVVKKIVKNKV